LLRSTHTVNIPIFSGKIARSSYNIHKIKLKEHKKLSCCRKTARCCILFM